jgi:hypothetical protein
MHTRKWLSTMALGGLVACSSGEGSPTMPPAVDNTAPIADSLPAEDSELAPADEQAPPIASESAQDTGSNPVLSLCTAGCKLPVKPPCIQEPPSECIAGCTELSVLAGACADQWLAVLQCILGQGQLDCETSVDEETGAPQNEIAVPEACIAGLEAVMNCGEPEETSGQPDDTNASDAGD